LKPTGAKGNIGHTAHTGQSPGQSPSPPRSLVRDGQTSPHRPLLVVPRSTCPPLFPSPHANTFIIGTAVINTHRPGLRPPSHSQRHRDASESCDSQSIHFFSPRHCQHLHPHARRIFTSPFLQAHRETCDKTEAHFNATGMPSQPHNLDSFRFRRAAF